MQDLNDMLFFAEVVERGGFAAAGRALGVPKSRLSRRVAALEAQLGVRLLKRTKSSLDLTEVGQTIFRHCQQLRIVSVVMGKVFTFYQMVRRMFQVMLVLNLLCLLH